MTEHGRKRNPVIFQTSRSAVGTWASHCDSVREFIMTLIKLMRWHVNVVQFDETFNTVRPNTMMELISVISKAVEASTLRNKTAQHLLSLKLNFHINLTLLKDLNESSLTCRASSQTNNAKQLWLDCPTFACVCEWMNNVYSNMLKDKIALKTSGIQQNH